MKILIICFIVSTLISMTIQYGQQTYPNKHRRQLYHAYGRISNHNKNDHNNNNNNNYYYHYHYNRRNGNHHPSKKYTKKKPKNIQLTRKYIMEGEAKHIHQKHGENHLKTIGNLFGFSDTYQGSDYALTTTFHQGSVSTDNGQPKYFSTYDTEGLIKHYQNSHGRAKFNVNAKSHGHEKYKDQKEMKAVVTFENNDYTIDDEANYSPTSHPYGKLEGY
ncbi:unnamed protein product [Schistosoma turkestanicum]|nr:unnamed protein product [Schistosoma turkestanicum]